MNKISEEYVLSYEIEGQLKEKKISLPGGAEYINWDKNVRKYEDRWGIKISYKIGRKKRAKIISISKDAENILLN